MLYSFLMIIIHCTLYGDGTGMHIWLGYMAYMTI